MTSRRLTHRIRTLLAAVCLTLPALASNAQSPSAEALINKLVEKGILTDKEAKQLVAETTNAPVNTSKWIINNAIKSIQLYGDVRLRYEYRSSENSAPPVIGSDPNAYYRERYRYALRLGLKGELNDGFYYGVRAETAENPRSPWLTFGQDNTTASQSTPFRKDSATIYLGQIYLGWTNDWFGLMAGKMPMSQTLYVTPMVWDSDISPEGFVEKVRVPVGKYVDLFANFAQFDYQDPTVAQNFPSSDTFMLAWQIGAEVRLTKDITLKAAPVIYDYTGVGSSVFSGSSAMLNLPYTGEGGGPASGFPGQNSFGTPSLNQNGINNLVVLEVPAELNFSIGSLKARVFGDFARNFQGDARARAAFAANNPPGQVAGTLTHAFLGQDSAYQIGAAVGNLGLVYGQTSAKNTWEARAYWQHIDQYALDVNLIDSDFFEGRANLEGVYAALAYSLTDNIIGTFRYGYARRINDQLGTGGNNQDLPVLNPIRNFHVLQLDLTWRF